VQTAAESPVHHALLSANVRRVRVRRFPYFVYYIDEGDRLTIIAVFHFRRDPNGWRQR
jgi:toxin ParE1/3/4